MSFFFVYLFEASVTSALLYIFYLMFLSNDTRFVVNRFFLILSLFVSAVIPLIRLNNIYFLVQDEEFISYMETIVVSSINNYSNFTISDYFLIAYFLVSFLLLTRFVIQLYEILHFGYNSQIDRRGKIIIFKLKEVVNPFNFFNRIYISKEQYNDDDLDRIIMHETIHSRQLHSADLIIIEIMKILFWINPFIYLYKKSITINHEYIADSNSIKSKKDIKEYLELIMKGSLKINNLISTNFFNSSTIKRRITMIKAQKSKHSFNFAVLVPIPLLLFLFFLFNSINSNDLVAKRPNSLIENSKKMNMEDEYLAQKSKKNKRLEQEPKCDFKELAKNVKYPEEARKKNIQGKVLVKAYVSAEGIVENAEVIKTPNKILNEPALKAVKSTKFTPAMENGKNVPASVVIPIQFKLQ